MKTELSKRISVIAAKLTIREPFIAAVLTRMQRRFIENEGYTVATDGVTLFFGLDWCSQLDDSELAGVCMHEALHAALMHPWRICNYDKHRFNYAADALINCILREKEYKLPSDGVILDWVTSEMSVENIYAKIKDENIDHGWGIDIIEGEKALEADMESAVLAAAKMAKACGDSSAAVRLVLGGALDPIVPWTDVLRHIMTAKSRDDYTFKKANRRYVADNLYMPSIYSEKVGGLVVAVDTSGSMSKEDLGQIAVEINAIAEDTNPDWVEIIYCDSQVTDTARFEQGDIVELELLGGGGTAFKPVFDHVAENECNLAALIYFTDLYGDFKCLETPIYPVVWAVTCPLRGRNVPSFGDVVEVL